MNYNKQQVFEPKSPFSASQFLDNSGIYKGTGGQTHWSVQKNLPWQVAAARAEKAAEDKKKEIRESFRHIPGKSIFLVARRQKGNTFKAIGFSEIFPTFQAVKDFAKKIGREKVKMGVIVASV